MIMRRLLLEGSFVEAFLYYDFVWLIGSGGETYAFDVERYLDGRQFPIYGAARRLFARNDLLHAERSGVTVAGRQDDDVRALLASTDIHVGRREVEAYSTIFDTGLDARSILDMRCYYGRAYVATDDRIEQLRMFGRSQLSHMGVGARGNGRLEATKVHDGRCIQFRAKFGALSAACGEDGGIYAKGVANEEGGWRAKFETFAPYSRGTEFIGDAVSNLTGGADIELYRTRRHAVAQRPDPDRHSDTGSERFEIDAIGGIDPASARLQSALDDVQRKQRLTFARTFLTTTGAFAFDADGEVRSFKMGSSDGIAPSPSSRRLPAAPGDVLGLTTCPLGIVAELDDAVSLLADGEWHTVFDEAAFSVRGYPTSRWHRNMITIVGAAHADVCSVAS